MTSSEHTSRSWGRGTPEIPISVEDAAMMLTRLHPVDRQGEEPSNDATRQLEEANRGGEERPKISVEDAAMKLTKTTPGRTPTARPEGGGAL